MYNMPPKKDLKCWTRTGANGAYTTCIDSKTGLQARRKAPAKKAPAKKAPAKPQAPYKDVDVKMLEKALAQAKKNAKARAMPVAKKPVAKKRELINKDGKLMLRVV
jgi:hypothetical protein